MLGELKPCERLNRLCELNVVEQVYNLALSTITISVETRSKSHDPRLGLRSNNGRCKTFILRRIAEKNLNFVTVELRH